VSTDADIATIREALAIAHPVTAEDHSLVEEAEAALERVALQAAGNDRLRQSLYELEDRLLQLREALERVGK
jgi:hypothetical protein